MLTANVSVNVVKKLRAFAGRKKAFTPKAVIAKLYIIQLDKEQHE